MAGLLDPGAYSLSWLSAPYLALSATLVVFVGYLLFTRGNPLQRMPLLCAAAVGLVFASAQAAAASCVDPAVARSLYRLAIAPVALVGPAVFALQMAVQDLLHRVRVLLVVGVVVAALFTVGALTTDLVVAGVWKTDWGMYYSVGGPLMEVHLFNLLGWAVGGAIVSSRKVSRGSGGHLRARSIRAVIVLVLLALACSDALLSRRIGVYPLSWVPTLLAMIVILSTLRRIDYIRARGRDVAAIAEAVVVIGLAAYAMGVVALVGGGLRIGLLVIGMIAAQLVGSAVRRRRAEQHSEADSEVSRAVDELVELCEHNRDADRLEQAVTGLLGDTLGLADVRLLYARDRVLRRQLDARVKAWILANHRPLIRERLGAERLGGLRSPVEKFLGLLQADVVLPLVDREQLVGVIATRERQSGAPLTDADFAALRQIQEATARSLTYIELYRDAQQRVEVAREVEIAAAVQHGRAPGAASIQHGRCEIISEYQPARQFGGDWWASAELPDGRVLLLIGDVSGHGVPAALITATVEGCCETAQHMLGGGFDVLSLMQLLNRSVLDVGHSRYLMSCFAAVFDLENMAVTFANAGHPFPYVCRADRLEALVSRGTPLGIEANPVISVGRSALEPGDLVVFYTDALVESANERGQRYGERRLQRVLRKHARGAGTRANEIIMDDARTHFGRRPIREDITLLCMRVGS